MSGRVHVRPCTWFTYDQVRSIRSVLFYVMYLNHMLGITEDYWRLLEITWGCSLFT